MSQLDQQIRNVRNKLSVDLFIDALASTLLAAASALLLYSIVRQFSALKLPRELLCLGFLLACSAAAAAWLAKRRQPDPLTAAVAIDDRLGLKEKFSTALHARQLQDPFSQALLKDAEQTAGIVDLHDQFPLHWPRRYWSVLVVALLSVAMLGLVRPRNLFSSNAPSTAAKTAATDAARERAKETIEKAIVTIDQAPKAVADKASLQLAKAELQDLLKKQEIDPTAANRKALSVMQVLQKELEAARQEAALAEARRNQQRMSSIKPDDGEKGAVAEAHKDMSDGDYDAAAQKLAEAVKNFDKLTPEDQAAAARQMQTLADQLKQATNDPQADQRLQQQLQQLGMSPQQQKEAQQLLKDAAKGDAKAAAQLKELAKQAVTQMNNGNAPTQEQLQQMEQNLQQAQAQANSQQQQTQLSDAAQRLAEAMAMRRSAQQNANAQQGQKSNQQPNAQQQSQDMQQAMADAQQQLQKMQAQSDGARQSARASQGAQQTASAAQKQLNGGAQPGGQGEGPGESPGESSADDDATQAAASGAKGRAGGSPGASRSWGTGHGNPLGAERAAMPPAQVDKALSNSENTDPDHVVASSLIKSDSDRGQSRAPLKATVQAAARQAAEEADTERVGREGQKVVRDYFGALGDAK